MLVGDGGLSVPNISSMSKVLSVVGWVGEFSRIAVRGSGCSGGDCGMSSSLSDPKISYSSRIASCVRCCVRMWSCRGVGGPKRMYSSSVISCLSCDWMLVWCEVGVVIGIEFSNSAGGMEFSLGLGSLDGGWIGWDCPDVLVMPIWFRRCAHRFRCNSVMGPGLAASPIRCPLFGYWNL